MEKAEKAVEKAAVRAKQADEVKEARSREWQQAQMDNDRKLRQDEFERQLRADERREERAERQAERKLELEVMKLQLQIALASSKGTSST